MGLLTTEFAHVLLINCIHLENLLHIPESIEKVTASQDGSKDGAGRTES
jgi:hypothetical protein